MIDNDLLRDDRAEGLFLNFDRLISGDRADPLRVLSTAKVYPMAPCLAARIGPDWPQRIGQPIGANLTQDHFDFRRGEPQAQEGDDQLERNLAAMMPAICTSANPTLDAARYNTQVEFDRTYRSIQRSPHYAGRNLLFIAGLNIDISPSEEMVFPLTKFVPWAAYICRSGGESYLLEQDRLVARLREQPDKNPRQISFDDAIAAMSMADEIKLPPVG